MSRPWKDVAVGDAPGSEPPARRALRLGVLARGGRADADAFDAALAAALDPLGADGPSDPEALVDAVAAALAWPDRPASRRAIARGLGRLAAEGATLVRRDGTPVSGDAERLLGWLEAAVLLGRAAVDEGVDIPVAFRAAVAAAAQFVDLRTAPWGSSPSPLVGWTAARLRERALALGWGSPTPPFDDDWSMWTFADGGVVVMHMGGKKPARIVVDARKGLPAPEVVVNGRPATTTLGFEGAEGAARIAVARVDVPTSKAVRKARILVEHPVATREILVRGQRVLVHDTPKRPGPVGLRLGPTNGAARWSTDARLAWRDTGDVREGHGTWDGGEAIRTAIEW